MDFIGVHRGTPHGARRRDGIRIFTKNNDGFCTTNDGLFTKHVGSDVKDYATAWRDSVFIEYYFVNDNSKCVGN